MVAEEVVAVVDMVVVVAATATRVVLLDIFHVTAHRVCVSTPSLPPLFFCLLID